MIESNLSSSVLIRDLNPARPSSNGVIDAGLRGLESSQNALVRSAQEVTFATVTSNENQPVVLESDIQQALVDQIRSQQVFNASAEVVAVGDENIGTLVDTIA